MPTRTDLQNWSHAALTIVGALSALLGAIQLGLAQYDPSISTQFAPQMLVIGGVLVTASKAIDSVSNWMLAQAAAKAGPVVTTPIG